MNRPLPFHSNAVWPPVPLAGFWLLAYALLDAGLWLIMRAVPGAEADLADLPEVRQWRSIALGFGAAGYALLRLWRFHPRLNAGYSDWLACSPWRKTSPLPLGPVTLVWQDLVVAGGLAAIAYWHARVDPFMPLLVFLLTHALSLTLLLAWMRVWSPVLVLGFLWPALLLPSLRGGPSIAILLALLATAWFGHVLSLQRFPWRRPDSLDAVSALRLNRAKTVFEREIRIEVAGPRQGLAGDSVGWPFQWLSPRVQVACLTWRSCLALSALAGWWTYCVMLAGELGTSPGLLLFFAMIAGMLRLSIYCSGIRPSINLWGRLTSGRFILPGFDKVFITPLLVVLTTVAGAILILKCPAYRIVLTALTVSATILVLLSGGPKLRTWLLTGQHRYSAPSKLTTNKQVLAPI